MEIDQVYTFTFSRLKRTVMCIIGITVSNRQAFTLPVLCVPTLHDRIRNMIIQFVRDYA